MNTIKEVPGLSGHSWLHSVLVFCEWSFLEKVMKHKAKLIYYWV